MQSLPLFLKLDGRRVLLVGEGEAAVAKLRLLAKTPARIHLVTRTPEDFAEFAEHPRLIVDPRGFAAADLEGAALVYGAVEDDGEAAAIAAAARAADVPVNMVDRPPLCDFITPAIVDRDPLTVAISTNGGAPVFGRRLRAMIEGLLPHDIGRVVARAGAFRDRLKALLPDAGARRRFWDRLFDSADTSDLNALSDTAFTARLERLAADEAAGRKEGVVQLVGAGPGDPELLTVKAQRALQTADVIVYDRLVAPAVLDYARRDAEFVFVGKTRGDHGLGQEGINALLVAHARAGRRIVRLKSGDPFVFGRAGEEIAALRAAGVAVEIVPGITAVAGCAATSQIPLTHRDHASAVTLITGHVKDGAQRDWRSLAGPGRTLAVYMGLSTAKDIAAALLADGVAGATPVAVIENGTRAEERRVYGRLADLPALVAREGVESPALIVVGEVARLARDWPAEALAPLLGGAERRAA